MTRTKFNLRTSLWAAAGPAALLTAGCAMGPVHPDTQVPLPPALRPGQIAPASGVAQTLVPGAKVDAQWWKAFASPALDALVARALASNEDLAAAEANLRQARELAKAANGARAPQVDAGYSLERNRTSHTMSNDLADPSAYLYTLHTADVSVSYPIDAFGGLKSQYLSARASADVAAHRLDAARSMVVANLVSAVILHGQYAAQLDAANAAVRNNRDLLDMMRRRRQLGDIGEADVAAQEAALASAQEALPALARALTHQESVIAMLLGIAPGSALPDLPALEDLQLPATLPVGLPAQIVANRPDVAAAEAQMRAAGADVGVAIAARLPQLQLTASAGGLATSFADMFASGNPFFAILGGVTQPLFHGGQLLHRERAAQAALDAAKAQYRASALQAFGDVQDALSGLASDAQALDAATRADAAARRNLDFDRRRLQLGGLGALALLNASDTAAQASSQLVLARAARLLDTVALFQAVGGGVDSSQGTASTPGAGA